MYAREPLEREWHPNCRTSCSQRPCRKEWKGDGYNENVGWLYVTQTRRWHRSVQTVEHVYDGCICTTCHMTILLTYVLWCMIALWRWFSRSQVIVDLESLRGEGLFRYSCGTTVAATSWNRRRFITSFAGDSGRANSPWNTLLDGLPKNTLTRNHGTQQQRLSGSWATLRGTRNFLTPWAFPTHHKSLRQTKAQRFAPNLSRMASCRHLPKPTRLCSSGNVVPHCLLVRSSWLMAFLFRHHWAKRWGFQKPGWGPDDKGVVKGGGFSRTHIY